MPENTWSPSQIFDAGPAPSLGGASAGIALLSASDAGLDSMAASDLLTSPAGLQALSMAGATAGGGEGEWLAGPIPVEDLLEFSPSTDAYQGQFLGGDADVQTFVGVLSGESGPWTVTTHLVTAGDVVAMGTDTTPIGEVSGSLGEVSTEIGQLMFPEDRLHNGQGFTWVAGGGEIQAREPNRNTLECGTTIPARITEDTVLQEGCTYTIPERKRGFVRVFEGATLTIEPGVDIEVAAGSSITVRDDGTLTARGAEDNPIEIYGSTEEPGHWQGIEIYSDDPANELSHVTVAHAGDVYWNSAVVMHRTDAAQATIRDCTIRESSSAGIKVDAGGELVDFRNNRIEDCQGPPLWLNPDLLTSLTGTTTVANNGQSHVLVDSDIGSLSPAAKTDGTWPAMDVPYEFSKGASIAAQIDIDEGTTLQFRGDNRPSLSVENGGRLVADASGSDPVTFKGVEDRPGTWRGIFVNTTTDNLLRNVVVSDGGGGYRNANIGVGVDAEGALTLEDSTISDSAGWGVRVTEDGTLSDNNNTYENNAEGAIKRPGE